MGYGKGAGQASGEGTGKGTTSECLAICGTATFCCLFVIIVTALAGLGIAKIAMGAIYLHDCNLQSMIPIFLIVSGVAPVLFGGNASSNNEESNFLAKGCSVIGLLFSIAWTIAGSVWVYPTWGIVKTEGYVPCTANATNCKSCNDVVLTFAFAMVTIDWILLGFFIVYVACSICAQLSK
ncbi:hypothetical protein CHS0354_024640 [Potamilus streckersoni]|uniref:Transmembrane protein n=1 Tax=Potamilus streckersoni TaxID=2493646 RepID=A0AAE0SW21_9BIVA|nr:hypothetical protein CHS0354_024640 [Potamilus streckersoni]